MRAVLQRVSRAEVRLNGRIMGKIARGLVVLLGVASGDSEADAVHLADRILGMRVFADDAGKMNCSLAQVGGALLVVSQFTLNGVLFPGEPVWWIGRSSSGARRLDRP